MSASKKPSAAIAKFRAQIGGILDRVPKAAETILDVVMEKRPEFRVSRELTLDTLERAIHRARRAAGHPVEPVDRPATFLYIDTETTGLHPEKDQIIQLAIYPFKVDRHGIVGLDRDNIYVEFNDPGVPIDPKIQDLTGITDKMVAGCAIDATRVAEIVDGARYVVAHNAAFDRPFLEAFPDEKVSQAFQNKPWLCSLEQIDWEGRGMMAAKLGVIAMQMGWHFSAHRADNDCIAGIASLLHGPVQPINGALEPEADASEIPAHQRMNAALEMMAKAADSPTRIWAQDAPFDAKDTLKERGYKWQPGGNGEVKAWWTDVPESRLPEELQFLRDEVYCTDSGFVNIKEISPFDAFSVRCRKHDRREALIKANIDAAVAQKLGTLIQGSTLAPEV